MEGISSPRCPRSGKLPLALASKAIIFPESVGTYSHILLSHCPEICPTSIREILQLDLGMDLFLKHESTAVER
jgi:hypothetical protein